MLHLYYEIQWQLTLSVYKAESGFFLFYFFGTLSTAQSAYTQDSLTDTYCIKMINVMTDVNKY